MPERIATEPVMLRLPPGTRARIDALRGRERQTDFLRRLLLEALDREEKRK